MPDLATCPRCGPLEWDSDVGIQWCGHRDGCPHIGETPYPEVNAEAAILRRIHEED